MPDPVLPRLARRGLLFGGPAVLGVLALLALVSWKQGLLSPTAPLYVMTQTATGITAGMPVKLNGFVVGQVADVQLLPPSTLSDRRVRVRLDVTRRYLDYIPRTTRARLAQEGLIGQPVIELVPERYDARSIGAGELVPFERTRGLPDIAADLEGRLAPVLDNAKVVGAGLADPAGNFQQLLANGNAAAAGVVRTNAEAQAMLAETRQAVAALSDGAAAPLQRGDRVLATVERDVPTLLSTLQDAADHARDATADIARLSGRSAEQVPRILDDAGQAAARGRAAADDVAGSWPLRVLRGEREAALAPADSLDGLPLPEIPVE